MAIIRNNSFYFLDPEPGYQYYKLRSCSGRNELYTGVVASRGECSKKCNEESTCVSFEWWGNSNPHPNIGENYCQVSSSCTHDESTASSPSDPADLYVKGDNIHVILLAIFIISETCYYLHS